MPIGRPTKYGVAMTSAERNAARRLVMAGVVDAAEGWARAWVAGSGVSEAEARLSAAVSAWRAYRGKGPAVGVRQIDGDAG